ncbi:MAG: hypothetical protein ACRD0K_21530 [Egibacteraceae bacterium]
MLRRKRMPVALQPAWDAFRAQALRVEQARSALLSCLPVGRVDPVPVPVGLDLVRDELIAVAGEMASWRHDATAAHWDACAAAVGEALAAVGEARRVATTSTELEELLGAVSDVVEPLDAWHDAERAWLRLRA